MKSVGPKKKRKQAGFSCFLLLCLILSNSFVPERLFAFKLNLGLGAGVRKINDDYLNKVYGSGFIFIPQLELALSNAFSAGLAYEGGYKKKAVIGLYKEPSVLKISGFEFSIYFHPKGKLLTPFLKAGTGYYFYRQNIDSPYVRHRVNHWDISFHGGCGIKLNFHQKISFKIETKYVYLKVKPFDQQVDLGGFQYIFSLILNCL